MFGHNYYFKTPNGKCKPSFDIYVLKPFQWYNLGAQFESCFATYTFVQLFLETL
jgi:hypothetical protein